jgi:peptidoglycan hydrolase-like protein with peptidoglycan-binding domain
MKALMHMPLFFRRNYSVAYYFFSVICVVFLGGTLPLFAHGASFNRNLQVGDVGADVRALQVSLNRDPVTRIAITGPGSPGNESDYFGLLTKLAVIRFQEKYSNEVLVPASLSRGSGFVGALTRLQLLKQELAYIGSIKPSSVTITPPTAVLPIQSSSKPELLSVSPDRVRRGDKVTIVGRNFSPTGNIVELGDGPISTTFEGLASLDGKTIEFIYEPPTVETMTKEQILTLPYDQLQKIEQPLIAAGTSLEILTNPYPGIYNETQLEERLKQNGYTADNMYHLFHVIVKNGAGATISKEPLLHGIRKFTFDTFAEKPMESFFASLRLKAGRLLSSLVPVQTAHAQQYGGGANSGIVMMCTCNGAVMTFQTDVAGGGSGLYVYMPGFTPMAGSCKITGMWLGGYQSGSGVCAIYVGIACTSITGNLPILPYGCSL